MCGATRRISLFSAAPPHGFQLAFSLLSANRLAHFFVAGRRWVVFAMLLALHAALVSEPGGIFQRLWLLVHFGLFLVWQPLVATERELEVLAVVLLLAITAATLYFVSGWMIITWLLLLLGILGGRVFTLQTDHRNRFYLVAFGYLVTVLLLWAVPSLIIGPRHVPDVVANFAQRILPLLLAMLLVMPPPEEHRSGQIFDFFYAVLVFQLGVVLVLGSIVFMRFTDNQYVESVALTVLGFGVALFIFAVLWNPMRGFGGLRTYFSAYLLSVGMPFELWMRRIAELSETEPDAGRFLEQALQEIAALPWMRGGRWRSPEGEGEFGVPGKHSTRFAYHGLELVFHTGIELSPALFLHMRLLAQVVAEFHEGKRRESALRRHAYLQAVHETGARLTHDVKNLLQSLYTLTSMAPRESADGYVGLLQRQLPELTKRLHTTLEKLRSPEIATTELTVRAREWWSQLERRLAGSGIEMHASIEADGPLPAGLFDSFVENALDNARAKREGEPGIAISIRLERKTDCTLLEICDTGAAVPEAIAQRLLREPIERGTGLGIGLYHVARQASQAGYSIALADNRDGRVCFTLGRGDCVPRASGPGQD
jgi:histidine kinase/DNA gyrase B/HSP90-like ATPase